MSIDDGDGDGGGDNEDSGRDSKKKRAVSNEFTILNAHTEHLTLQNLSFSSTANTTPHQHRRSRYHNLRTLLRNPQRTPPTRSTQLLLHSPLPQTEGCRQTHRCLRTVLRQDTRVCNTVPSLLPNGARYHHHHHYVVAYNIYTSNNQCNYIL